MIKVGLISDTHGYLDPDIFDYFSEVDEIWHAGDFGNIDIVRSLEQAAPLLGVYGNIDDQEVRSVFPLHQKVEREGLKIWMTHIGGILGRYCIPIREEITKNPPDIFICGHSHILKIGRDQDLNGMLFINPGAAGRQGFQVYRTIVRFELHERKIQNVEVIHLGKALAGSR